MTSREITASNGYLHQSHRRQTVHKFRAMDVDATSFGRSVNVAAKQLLLNPHWRSDVKKFQDEISVYAEFKQLSEERGEVNSMVWKIIKCIIMTQLRKGLPQMVEENLVRLILMQLSDNVEINTTYRSYYCRSYNLKCTLTLGRVNTYCTNYMKELAMEQKQNDFSRSKVAAASHLLSCHSQNC